MTFAQQDLEHRPTFLYRGRRFLWGYSPDRQVCGMWSVEDPAGEAHQTWPISEHAEAWDVYRNTEPRAVAYEEDSEDREAADGRVEPRDDFAEMTDSTSESHGPGRRRSLVMWRRVALVIALVAALAFGAVFGASKLISKKPAAVSPSQAVLTAASNTEALHTAHTTLTVTVRGIPGSGPVSAVGSGEVDFTNSAGSTTLTIEGQKVSIVSVGGTLYESLPTISQYLPGKSWLSVPEGRSGQTSGGVFTAGDPAQMIHLLQAEGNIVVPTGTTIVDGSAVTGYSVTINKAAVASQLSGSGLPPDVVQAAQQFLDQVGPISYRLYVDSAQQLRAMDFTMTVPTGSETVSVSASVVLSDYGAPVSVSAPPASEVASLQDFLKAGSSAGI